MHEDPLSQRPEGRRFIIHYFLFWKSSFIWFFSIFVRRKGCVQIDYWLRAGRILCFLRANECSHEIATNVFGKHVIKKKINIFLFTDKGFANSAMLISTGVLIDRINRHKNITKYAGSAKRPKREIRLRLKVKGMFIVEIALSLSS